MTDGRKFYVGGGRRWVEGDHPWEFFSALRVLEDGRWSHLPDLPDPLADTCLLVTRLGGRKRLWVFGGSNIPQRLFFYFMITTRLITIVSNPTNIYCYCCFIIQLS